MLNLGTFPHFFHQLREIEKQDKEMYNFFLLKDFLLCSIVSKNTNVTVKNKKNTTPHVFLSTYSNGA
jgi:hypothetical protein